MAEKIALLVCEGETDVYIFQALSAHFSSIEVRPLAPRPDATSSGAYPSHGFGDVLKWCFDNQGKIQLSLDVVGARALFLQMDTDIATQVNLDCINKGHSARHCCQEKLNEKLGVLVEPPRCHYILPTQNTETWILASHEPPERDENSIEISNYEFIHDTEQRLIDLGYPSRKGKSNKAGRKLDKKPATKYKKYGKQLTDNLTLARQRCAELDRLCHLLEAII